MVKIMNTSRDVVAARPRAQAAFVTLAGTHLGFGGAVRPEYGRTSIRTDVFPTAPGSCPGGHPA